MDTRGKIVSLDEAASLTRDSQRSGRTVALCHGCFDLVHPGHVRHLQHAARLGDHLLVTIAGDAMVDKGTGRPLIPQELRAENLAALDCVDWVAVNPAPTAVELLEVIKPDFYVKGREYESNRDPRFQAERGIVERVGGRVVFTSGDVVFSSTALINALAQAASSSQDHLAHLMAGHALTAEAIDDLIAAFRGARVLVVGESILDTYVSCDRPEVTGEGPMMSLRPVEYRHFDGGAAIIARHLAAMGARPHLITALPDDDQAALLRSRLETAGVDVCSITCRGRMIEKQRFHVGSTKVMKLHLGEPITLDASGRGDLSRMILDAARDCDAVIVADYGQGLFTSGSMTELCRLLRPCSGLLVGDVSGRRSNLLSMQAMDLLCPSELELREALHDYDEGLSAVAWRLLHRTNSQAAMVTLGPEGLIVFDRTGQGELQPDAWETRLSAEHLPALMPHAIDPLGCGDALLAAVTLARIADGSLTVASVLGAVAAAAESQHLGNLPVNAMALRDGTRRLCDAHRKLVAEPETAVVARDRDQLRIAHP